MEQELYKIGYTKALIKIVLNALDSFQPETAFEHILTTYNYLLNFGFSPQQIFKITRKYPKIYTYNSPNLDIKFKNLFSYSYSRKEIIRMCSKFPALLGLTPKLLDGKRTVLLVLYSTNELRNMTLECPSLYARDVSEIIDKVQYFIKLGYTQDEAIMITSKMPNVLNLSCITKISEQNLEQEEKVIEKVDEKIGFLRSYGYSDTEILKMGKRFPTIFCLSLNHINEKLQGMEKLDLSVSDIIQMTTTYPNIFCMGIDKLCSKINFYREISLGNIIIYDTPKLMQRLTLSKARYNFFLSKGIDINVNSYNRLFYGEKQWLKQFEFSNEEIIKIYG